MTRRIATAALAGAAMPVLAAAGCLSTPPYQPETRVSYAQDGTGATVAGTAAGFELHFASGSGFPFPDKLLINGSTDILGHGQTLTCDAANEAGLLISPTPRISAHSDAAPEGNQLDAVLRGPAVVQVALTWATRFACDLAHAPGGTSTFTVFPDGRIVRYDTVKDPVPGIIAASDCACPGAPTNQGFTISSYWALEPTAFQNLWIPGSTADPQEVATLGNQEFPNYAVGCLDGGTYQVATAWSDPTTSKIAGGDALIVLGREHMPGASRIDDILPWSTSSALFIISRPDQRSPCETALDRASEFVLPSPPLTINGTATTASDRDGIYGGDSGAGPGIRLTTNRATLTGVLNGSFAVWLRFPSSVDAVRARLAGQSGPWYLPQRVDDRTWIVWFPGPLGLDQTIVIEPF